MSAAIAVLALASGDGTFDAAGNLLVTAKHVEARLPASRFQSNGFFPCSVQWQVASRLVELNLQIRAEFRGPLPSSGERPEDTDSEADISKPVQNSGPFGEPAATQPPPRLPAETSQAPSPTGPVEQDYEPVIVPDEPEDGRADEDMEPQAPPLTFSQLPSDFFKQGLGEDNAMIFKDDTFQDRLLVYKVLLSGQSKLKLARIVDLYNHVDINDSGKHRKIRPSQGQARNGIRKVL